MTGASPGQRPLARLVAGPSLIFIAGLLGLFPSPATGSDASTQTTFVRYIIDRSAVPDWVIHRELTLLIDVSGAEAVWAWEDGMPMAPQHDPETGTVLVTTTATEILLAAQGDGLSEEAGDFCVATLRDNKGWAFSLTFDDGQLSVYQYAFPELRRYGYRAAVAVIGQWLEREDTLEHEYCRRQELLGLIDAGWSIFNHSYSHFNSPYDATFEEAQRCQDAIRTWLNGYEATVFTVPFTSPEWVQVIDENAETLGLYLTQLQSDDGARLAVVDDPISLAGGTYHLRRDDIKHWVEGNYNYFDQAHGYAAGDPPAHVWVSLHAHNIKYDRDWCAVSDAASYLYHAYGAGGTDEVWVAPADEVFQYLMMRSYATVSRADGTSRELGPGIRPPASILYQQGRGGYSGWHDTHIYEAAPAANHEPAQSMVLGIGGGMRSSLLLRADLAPPDGEAIVLNATLSLYASSHSNPWAMDLVAYPLAREWRPAEATWENSLDGVPWDLPGARGPGSDRGDERVGTAHVDACPQSERWYTLDVTDLVASWASDPDQNLGLLVEGAGTLFKSIGFASSEYFDPARRPMLRVLYGWPRPGPTLPPEPTLVPTIPPAVTPEVTPFSLRFYLPMMYR